MKTKYKGVKIEGVSDKELEPGDEVYKIVDGEKVKGKIVEVGETYKIRYPIKEVKEYGKDSQD